MATILGTSRGSEALRVLVVGAGISGLATAGALARSGGHVEVVERAPEIRALGSGITLIAPALKAMRDLDVYDECIERGFPLYSFDTYSLAGELVGSFPLPSMLGEGEPGMLGIMRPELHTVLLRHAVRQGVTLRAGVELRQLIQSAGGEEVEAVFDRGDRRRYDLVVGADGIRSTVRELVFGPLASEFAGQGTFRIVLPRPAELTSEVQFTPAGEVFVGFTPTGADSVYMYLSVPVDEGAPLADDLVVLTRRLLEPFGGYVARLRDEIRHPGQINFSTFRTLIAPAPWSSGRIVILGDAAHCPTPQLAAGAAMCLEDAAELAAALSRTDDVIAALAHFSARRHERCRYIVETSRLLSYWQTHPDTPGARHEEVTAEAFRQLAEVDA